MTSLSVVLVGPENAQRLIGYVDDLGGVYDLQQRRIGAVGMERNRRFAIQDLRGSVIGSVEVVADDNGGHAVYDNLNTVIGTGFAGRFVDAATGQNGVIAYNAGHNDAGGVISGAAFLLLLHSPVSASMVGGGMMTFDQTLQQGLHAAQTGINSLLQSHKQTLEDRQDRAKTGNIVNTSASQRMKTAGTTIVEMIPGGLGPWGIGDVVTFYECAVGRTFDGLRLSQLERVIYFGASVIPVVPARPVVWLYRLIERGRAHEAEVLEAEHRGIERSTRLDDIPSAADLDPLNVGAAHSSNQVIEDTGGVPHLAADTGQWETCQIEAHSTLMNMRVHFTAQALGPRGVYIAGSSRGVGTASEGTDYIKKQGPTVNELVKRLIAQGWEPLPDRGPYWFSYRFRRRTR